MCWLKNGTQTPRGQCWTETPAESNSDLHSSRVFLGFWVVEDLLTNKLMCKAETESEGRDLGRKSVCAESWETPQRRAGGEGQKRRLRNAEIWGPVIAGGSSLLKTEAMRRLRLSSAHSRLWFWQLPLLLLASCVEITRRWHLLHCCRLDWLLMLMLWDFGSAEIKLLNVFHMSIWERVNRQGLERGKKKVEGDRMNLLAVTHNVDQSDSFTTRGASR